MIITLISLKYYVNFGKFVVIRNDIWWWAVGDEWFCSFDDFIGTVEGIDWSEIGDVIPHNLRRKDVGVDVLRNIGVKENWIVPVLA